MFYSNVTLRELVYNEVLKIKPLPDYQAFQPSGIDLKLSDRFIVPPTPDRMYRTVMRSSVYQLDPGKCVLGSTVERVHVPRNMVMFVHGKSSLGRLFMSVHQTAGLVDAGFYGSITLEFVNHSEVPIYLCENMYVCQVTVAPLDCDASPAYGDGRLNSHYQGQKTTTPSYHEDHLEVR